MRGKRPNYEVLRPDLEHPGHGPHWDYFGPKTGGKPVRVYPNGSWEFKNKNLI